MYVGHPPVERENVDEAKICTFVDSENPFEENGVLDNIEVYTKGDMDEQYSLIFGVFQPSSEQCVFTLKYVIDVGKMSAGFQKVRS